MQEVDGADTVGLEDPLDVLNGCSHEYDRNVFESLALFDGAGNLEAIHAGHGNVHQDDRKLLPKDTVQSLFTGSCRDEVVVRPLEDRGQREKVSRSIIDQQNLNLLAATLRFTHSSLRQPSTAGESSVGVAGSLRASEQSRCSRPRCTYHDRPAWPSQSGR